MKDLSATRTTGATPGAGRFAGAIILGLGLCACAAPPAPGTTFHPATGVDPGLRQLREAEMNRQWENRPLEELLSALGRPRMVVSIPGRGMPPSFAVIYGVDRETGCIDAFAVHSTGAPLVRTYHCR